MKNIERLNMQNEKQQQHQQALMKNLDRLSSKANSQQQQHQVLMKYIESIVDEKSVTTSDTEGSSSRSKEICGKKVEGFSISDEPIEDMKKDAKEEEDKIVERNKFKKFEMPVFNRNDPNSWLFRADRFGGNVHNGLFPWIRAEQVGLPQMMRLAQKAEIEEIIRKEANLSGYLGGKYLYNPANYNKPNNGSNSNEGKAGGTIPMRTITLRSSANGELKKEGPSKRLSDTEFKAKREKGLCFKCDEKYYSGHKCKEIEHGELRMFMVRADNVEEEIIEEDYYEQKELNMFEMEGGVNAVVELSINSVVGLTNPGAIKVRGIIHGEEVVFLIDCGATHNFISDKLVNDLKLHTNETSHYGVILESGTAIKGKGVYENVDAILGMQWLYSSGVTEMDWRNLTMTFIHEKIKW
ncbi:ty3-gypsy retrotransposon protein [Cucumis melo var. makuwa]|nr:ty3-gypsy retrotransposon protein [Cucumis melo var. makuwa]